MGDELLSCGYGASVGKMGRVPEPANRESAPHGEGPGVTWKIGSKALQNECPAAFRLVADVPMPLACRRGDWHARG